MNAEMQVATAPTRSVLFDMAARYGMDPVAFEATVRATCSPTGNNTPPLSREEFAAFLLVAKEYRLNPLTREIYAFPKKGGGIVPVVSIDGWVNLVNSHPALDGISFIMNKDDEGNLESYTCRIFRKDRSHPIEVTEYLAECIRATDPWKMKHRMLRHKSLIQCARYAFGFSGIYDEEEGMQIARGTVENIRDVTPPRSQETQTANPLADPRKPARAALPPPDETAIIVNTVKMGEAREAEMVTVDREIVDASPAAGASMGGHAEDAPSAPTTPADPVLTSKDYKSYSARMALTKSVSSLNETHAAQITKIKEAHGISEIDETGKGNIFRLYNLHKERIEGRVKEEEIAAALATITG